MASTRSPDRSLPSAGWPGNTSPTTAGESSVVPRNTTKYSASGKARFISGPANTITTRFQSGCVWKAEASSSLPTWSCGFSPSMRT